MTTQPTHWIAGTGQITPVIILEAGIGGHTPSYTPPDPVVVRSVEDYYEFVASESHLFTDRTRAIVEARRLQDDQRRQAARALARIERQELLNGTSLFPMSLSIPLKDDDGTRPPVIEVVSESISSNPPVEDVVKKSDQDDSAKPHTLLDRVIYVIGRDTISFDEVCQRLQKRHWMPKRRSSVSNVLSAHKNLFNCPSRGVYSLRSKPKANPIDDSVTDNSVADEPETNETEEDLEAVGADDDGEDKGASEEEGLEDSEDEASKEEAKLSEFDVWMGKPMRELTPQHSHFRDDDVVFSEKYDNGTWTAEIFVAGLDLWSEGSSGDRSQAREAAENNLRAKVSNVSRIVIELGI